MEYRQIHYWQYVPGQEEEEVLEAALVMCEKGRHHETLSEIAAFITKHTGAKHVLIGRLSDDMQNVHTLVMMEDGKLQDNFTYSLKGTPCEETMCQRFCYYPFDVAASFPEDEDLDKMGVTSYLGSMLLSEENDPIGLIVLMDDKQIANAAFAEHLIMVLSPAIEEEIKLMKL
ncbi:hypothetical protein [Pontibacter chinhatensis]|uniref:GAF domain-containing protein n=1 Tax=Pontibacter chinhatensis TaxID=1436961 RepID=A0A1I2X486_9BACT|nr:hypothetical protein [Pontibacter chinhatensis]SFH07749.1 hypothetical protein SAMN05421739_105348 [Pontibacter chinhatensis]